MSAMIASAPPGLMTAEEFYEWANRPENDHAWFELEDGKVVEMPPPQGVHGTVAGWIVHLLWQFAIQRGKGHVTSNDTGLIVRRRPDTVRGADIMYFEETKPLEEMAVGYIEETPTLVVEIRSPSDRPGKLNKRIKQYLAKGVPLVWVVHTDKRSVDVHQSNQDVESFGSTEILDGGAALPDLRLPVADLFRLPNTK